MAKIDFTLIMGIFRLLLMSADLMEPTRPAAGQYTKKRGSESQRLKDCYDAVQWFSTGSNYESYLYYY